MSSRKPGAPEQLSRTPSQADKRSKAVALELTIRPVQLFELEAIIEGELEMPLLPIAERSELAQQCKLVLEKWRAQPNAQLLPESAKHADLTIEQIRCASESVRAAEIDWNPLRNNIDLARKLLDEGYRPLADLASEYGRLAVLAVTALNDPIQAGRAESLLYVVTLLYRELRETLEFNEKATRMAIHSIVDEFVTKMGPSVAAMDRQGAALKKSASKGAAANKARGEQVRAYLRRMARELWDKNPTWGVQDMVQHIHGSAGQIKGRAYGAATIRRHIKGVHQEWRKDYESRRKKAGLYTLDR